MGEVALFEEGVDFFGGEWIACLDCGLAGHHVEGGVDEGFFGLSAAGLDEAIEKIGDECSDVYFVQQGGEALDGECGRRPRRTAASPTKPNATSSPVAGSGFPKSAVTVTKARPSFWLSSAKIPTKCEGGPTKKRASRVEPAMQERGECESATRLR